MSYKNVQYENGKFRTSSGGSGGSTVTITPTLSSGQKIADYEIDGIGGELYAPSSPSVIFKGTIQANSYTDVTISANHMYIIYFVDVSSGLYGYYFVIYQGGSSSSNIAIVASAGQNTAMVVPSLQAANTMRITLNNNWGRSVTVIEL